MKQYDQKIDLKINVSHNDLNFTVQYFLPYILKSFGFINIILVDYEYTS